VEAALLVVNLVAMMLLILWSAREDMSGFRETGAGFFDLRPGAECDERTKPFEEQ
jgi:hypothetical protein